MERKKGKLGGSWREVGEVEVRSGQEASVHPRRAASGESATAAAAAKHWSWQFQGSSHWPGSCTCRCHLGSTDYIRFVCLSLPQTALEPWNIQVLTSATRTPLTQEVNTHVHGHKTHLPVTKLSSPKRVEPHILRSININWLAWNYGVVASHDQINGMRSRDDWTIHEPLLWVGSLTPRTPSPA